MTKQEILTQLSYLDQATLQKLYNYSQFIIIPEEDMLINATMIQMQAKAMALADQYFPEWTDRSKSDFGTFLVELMCLFSEKDFWYINAFANEALLSKMSVYSDAFTRAVSLGYDPILCKGAESQFDVVFKQGDAYTYLRGELIIKINGTDLQFTNDAPFDVPSTATPSIVPIVLKQGLLFTENVTFNGSSIILSRFMIDVESVTLSIGGLTWTRVRTFGQSDAGSTHFVVLPEENGAMTIFFGEDGFGQKPDLGTAIKVLYRVTSGAKGNSEIGQALIADSSTTRQAISAQMATDATKGTDPETLAQIKNNAPLYFSTKRAAINVEVTEQILESYNEVKRAKVTVIGNNVFFRVIPTDGTVASDALLSMLNDRLTPLLMLGYTCKGQQTNYVNVAPISYTIYALKGYDISNILSLSKQLVEDYTNPLVLAGYGQNFDLSELSVLIKSRIPGVQNVVFNSIAGGTPANVIVDNVSIRKHATQDQITATGLTIWDLAIELPTV